MKKILFLIILVLFLGACGSGSNRRGSIKNIATTVEGANKNREEAEYKSAKEEQLAKMPPIETFFPEEIEEESKHSSSLWGTERKSLYADSKASQKGDIVFILIKEEVTAEINYTLEKSGYTNYADGRTDEVPVTLEENSVRGSVGQNNEVATLEEEPRPESSDFNGEGESTGELIFDGKITARVEGVDKYGNLFVKGSKTALVNNEVVVLEISGYVRSRDIGTDNTVSSEYIDSMEFTYNGAMYLGKPVLREFGSNEQYLDNGDDVKVEEEEVQEEEEKKKWFFGLF